MFFVRVTVPIVLFAVFSDAFRLNRGLKRGKRETGDAEPDYKWFTQILDHFDPSNVEAKWNQRYLVNDEHYRRKNGGPVFLEISGELEMTELTGAGLNYAEKFGAMCFKLEHRYYGKSRPTSNLSVQNLRYLSSHQALADIANFIWHMTSLNSFPAGTKWIVFGGSYAGSLAAWSRLKYPHLIHAAVASSPIMEPKPEFPDYFETVHDVIANYDVLCADSIYEANSLFEQMINITGGAKILSKMFRLCSDLDPRDKNQIANAANELSFVFPEIVQSSKATDGGTMESLDIVCKIMTDSAIGLPLQRYSNVDYILNSEVDCRNVAYRTMITLQRNEENFDFQRQWLWQCCTELGLFLTTPDSGSMFGSLIDVQYYLNTCSDAFNSKFTKSRVTRATEINRIEFGGKTFKGTRVVIVTGSIDPWKNNGIIDTDDPSVVKITIDGTSHCADMEPWDEDDSIPLTEAREKIEDILTEWISIE